MGNKDSKRPELLLRKKQVVSSMLWSKSQPYDDILFIFRELAVQLLWNN